MTSRSSHGALVVASVVGMLVGSLTFLRFGAGAHIVGYVLSALVPPVLLGLHNQRAQFRRRALGIIMSPAAVFGRRLILVTALVLGAFHAYFFAVALELSRQT